MNRPSLALLGTVVATVMTSLLALVSCSSDPVKIVAQSGVPDPVPVRLFAMMLNPVCVRLWLVVPLVGLQFPFPPAIVRTSIGLLVCVPIACSSGSSRLRLRLLMGLIQENFSLLNRALLTATFPSTLPVWCVFLRTGRGSRLIVFPVVVPRLRKGLCAQSCARQDDSVLAGRVTDTLPLPSMMTSCAFTRLVPPSVLKVTFVSTVLLLTMVTVLFGLLFRLCVVVNFSVVSTEAEERFVLNGLKVDLSCPANFDRFFLTCRAWTWLWWLARTPRGQYRRFML